MNKVLLREDPSKCVKKDSLPFGHQKGGSPFLIFALEWGGDAKIIAGDFDGVQFWGLRLGGRDR